MSSNSHSLRKPAIFATVLTALLLTLTLAPKAFSANPPLMPNVTTPPFSATFASQPTTVVPGTCAHWVVDVMTLRDVLRPWIEISGWIGVQPCQGTTSLRQEYILGSPAGNPYWKFPARLVHNGVVPKGTHYQFTLNAYISYSSGSQLQ